MILMCYDLFHLILKIVFSNMFIKAQFVFWANIRNIEMFERLKPVDYVIGKSQFSMQI